MSTQIHRLERNEYWPADLDEEVAEELQEPQPKRKSLAQLAQEWKSGGSPGLIAETGPNDWPKILKNLAERLARQERVSKYRGEQNDILRLRLARRDKRIEELTDGGGLKEELSKVRAENRVLRDRVRHRDRRIETISKMQDELKEALKESEKESDRRESDRIQQESKLNAELQFRGETINRQNELIELLREAVSRSASS